MLATPASKPGPFARPLPGCLFTDTFPGARFELIEKAVRRITVTRRTESGATALAELTTINTGIRHHHANACPKNKKTRTSGICREIFIEGPGDYQ